MHDESRFWEKARIGSADTCWEWHAGRDNNGYGIFWRDGKSWKAHRVAWELRHGPLPDDQHVTQTCRNHACVNPHHLVAMPGARAQGTDHPLAKLLPEQIPEIRAALAAGESYTALAKQYGVNKAAIRDLDLGNSWTWVK